MNIININKQIGMTLIISNVVLIGILFLTLANIRSSIYQRSIVTATQTEQQMKFAAEAAVRKAEQEIFAGISNSSSQQSSGGLIGGILTNVSQFTDQCLNGLCKPTSAISTLGIWNNTTLWNNARSLGSEFDSKIKFITTPKYLIEFMGERDETQSMSQGQTYQDKEDYSSSPVYRVTGKSKDQKNKKETVIQTTIY